MLILKKIIWLCKFIWGLVVVEEKIDFKLRADFCFSKNPPDFIAYTCLSYKFPEVKSLVHSFKYNKNSIALNICADFLVEKIISISKQINLSQSILIPIPRSKIRLQKYGFDQCDLLCREILKNPQIKNLNLIYEPKILIHKKEFDSQTKSNRRQRILNSQKSFLVKTPEKISGRQIILIDDVWTTGATLLDATRALKESTATKIVRFTIAH